MAGGVEPSLQPTSAAVGEVAGPWFWGARYLIFWKKHIIFVVVLCVELTSLKSVLSLEPRAGFAACLE